MRSSFLRILILALIISSFGVLSIYSSTYQKEGTPWQDIHKRQMLWLIIGLACFIIMSHLNYRKLWDANYFIYGAAIFFLFLVFGLGNGKVSCFGFRDWFDVEKRYTTNQ